MAMGDMKYRKDATPLVAREGCSPGAQYLSRALGDGNAGQNQVTTVSVGLCCNLVAGKGIRAEVANLLTVAESHPGCCAEKPEWSSSQEQLRRPSGKL